MAIKGVTGITNLYLYRKFLGITDNILVNDTEKVEQLKYIIDETNDLIGQKCARVFGINEYKEWIPTQGENYVVVDNYPITNVKLISLNQIDLMTIEATNVSIATVQANNESIILSTIATDGSTDDVEVISYSNYANVASVVTVINNLPNWSSEVLSNNDSSVTTLIKPIASSWALDQKVYLEGPYLGSRAEISYDSDAIIEFNGYANKLFVWYEAGYTLPTCDEAGGTLTIAGNVPQGLTMVANRIIKETITQLDEDANMKSEKIGDYGYSRDGISSAIDRNWSDLNQYSRKSV